MLALVTVIIVRADDYKVDEKVLLSCDGEPTSLNYFRNSGHYSVNLQADNLRHSSSYENVVQIDFKNHSSKCEGRPLKRSLRIVCRVLWKLLDCSRNRLILSLIFWGNNFVVKSFIYLPNHPLFVCFDLDQNFVDGSEEGKYKLYGQTVRIQELDITGRNTHFRLNIAMLLFREVRNI